MTYRSETNGNGVDESFFGDNGSDLIFSGEHAADNGLTTFFNLDLDGFDTTQAASDFQGAGDGGGDLDEASVGIRGAFGQILVGSNTSAYDAYADYADIEQIGDRTSFSPGDQSDVIQYSNTLDNLNFMVSLEVGDQSDPDGGSPTALDVGAELDLGAITLSGAYNDRAASDDGDAIYGVGATATVGAVDLTVGHEVDDQDESIDKTVFTASYGTGPWTVTGSIQNVNLDNSNTDTNVSAANQEDDSFTEVYAGVTYSLTSQVTVYGETMTADRLNDEDDYTGVGVNYSW